MNLLALTATKKCDPTGGEGPLKILQLAHCQSRLRTAKIIFWPKAVYQAFILRLRHLIPFLDLPRCLEPSQFPFLFLEPLLGLFLFPFLERIPTLVDFCLVLFLLLNAHRRLCHFRLGLGTMSQTALVMETDGSLDTIAGWSLSMPQAMHPSQWHNDVLTISV